MDVKSSQVAFMKVICAVFYLTFYVHLHKIICMSFGYMYRLYGMICIIYLNIFGIATCGQYRVRRLNLQNHIWICSLISFNWNWNCWNRLHSFRLNFTLLPCLESMNCPSSKPFRNISLWIWITHSFFRDVLNHFLPISSQQYSAMYMGTWVEYCECHVIRHTRSLNSIQE